MEIRPILSAMRRNKVGAFLIALQMALTLAILCNALFIVNSRIKGIARPSGIDEANIFTIDNAWVGQPTDLKALQDTDLAALRSLPGVVDASIVNSFPLHGGGWSTGVSLQPDQKHSTAQTADYFADDHALNALGVKLIAGRWFNADEIVDRGENDENSPSGIVIVTQSLAEKLFPDGSALGKTVYVDKGTQTIVGIVERMQTPWVSLADTRFEAFVSNSLLEPNRFVSPGYYYLVRTQPGQVDPLLQAAQKKLLEVNHARVFGKVQPFSQTRAEAYRDDRGLAIILSVICAVLLAVTSFGIVGLTSFWVTQRRRQIGVRRALGATRRAIVSYFQTENLLIAASAAAIGAAFAIGLNLLLVKNFEMTRLPVPLVIAAAVFVLLLGQLAVLWPALRAAAIPPALATRAA